jgi:DNA-binding beta-propeller fold protein YncE
MISDVVLGLAAGVGVRLSPDGTTAYYVEWSIGRLSRAEVATGLVTTVQERLTFPQDVLVDWDTGEIFVSQRTGAILHVIPGQDARVVAEPGGAPHQLALAKPPGERFLYTVCFDSGRLLRIDLNRGGAIHEVCTGLGHPVGLAVDDANQFAYVTEQDRGAITKVTIADGSRAPIQSGLTAPFFLAWDRTAPALYCIQRDPANSLVRLALGPPLALTTVATGLGWRPSGVAPNHDGSLIYVCSDGKLEVISAGPVRDIPRPPPPFEVHSIAFNFAQQAIPIQNHLTRAPIPVPEYQRGLRNEPACYLRRTTPTIRVVLRRLPGFVAGTYTIGATGSLGGVRYRDVTPSFGVDDLSSPVDFELMWPLPDRVARADVSLEWFARRVPGPSPVASVGSAVHRLYVILARPTAPWSDRQIPWAAALNLACGWAAGAGDPDAAAGLIAERYNGSGMVSYDTVSGNTFYGWMSFNLTEMLERLTGGIGLGEKVNCTDSADTVATLANLLGCDLWESRMEAGFYMNPIQAIGYTVWAPPFWGGFGYHEVAWKGGCTAADALFDGCLKVDGDANPTVAPHSPLLPVNIVFGDCATMNYRLRLCTPNPDGCPLCVPQPATRQRRALV